MLEEEKAVLNVGITYPGSWALKAWLLWLIFDP